MATQPLFLVFLCWSSIQPGSWGNHLLVSENSTSKVYVEVLRGRDGLPGRDGPPGPHGPAGKCEPHAVPQGGATYTRWGTKDCPEIHGTEKVYDGKASGSSSDEHSGGGVNYLCMPEVPDYDLSYASGSGSSVGKLYGADYIYPVNGIHHHNVPCAVCHVPTRASVIMIPAKVTCPDTWYREYYGYLMSEGYNHKRSTFECVDRVMDSSSGSSGAPHGTHFHHVEAVCNVGIPCPPYNNHKQLNCVVCTK